MIIRSKEKKLSKKFLLIDRLTVRGEWLCNFIRKIQFKNIKNSFSFLLVSCYKLLAIIFLKMTTLRWKIFVFHFSWASFKFNICSIEGQIWIELTLLGLSKIKKKKWHLLGKSLLKLFSRHFYYQLEKSF